MIPDCSVTSINPFPILHKYFDGIISQPYPRRSQPYETMRDECVFPPIVIEISKKRRPGNGYGIFGTMHKTIGNMSLGADIGKKITIILHQNVLTCCRLVEIKLSVAIIVIRTNSHAEEMLIQTDRRINPYKARSPGFHQHIFIHSVRHLFDAEIIADKNIEIAIAVIIEKERNIRTAGITIDSSEFFCAIGKCSVTIIHIQPIGKLY